MRTTRRQTAMSVLAMTAALIASVATTPTAAAAAQTRSSAHKPVVTSVDYQGFASGGSVGGARVTVKGHHFSHVKSVRFGDSEGSNVHVVSTTELTVTAPAHPIAEVHVHVTTKAGSSAVSSDNVFDFQQRQRLAGGYFHSCQALKQQRTVRCWGDDSAGELGDDGDEQSNVPVAVEDLTDVVAVTAGFDYSCALLASGEVDCWGVNGSGQLGHGDKLDWGFPVPVRDLDEPALAITAGVSHTCAVLVGNTVSCWGNNDDGELGDGTMNDSLVPVAVTQLSSVTSVSAGDDATCATRSDGHEYCWGDDGDTDPSSLPVRIAGVSKAVATSTNGSTSCVLTRGGAVRCWGAGKEGELGNGHARNSSTPVAVSGVSKATQLAVGFDSACVVVAGLERCWGAGNQGQLGNGTDAGADTPVHVKHLTGVTDIACGAAFALATLSGGATDAWGENLDGELGDGSTDGSDVPVHVP